MAPLLQKIPVAIKNLDADVATIADEGPDDDPDPQRRAA